jgi:uncharacterized repeat protein (TIGR03843 family)
LLTTDEAVRALTDGELEIMGRLAEASNATLYCEVHVPWSLPDRVPAIHAVYKPTRGERPLDDFPDRTLGNRELAAWLVSEVIGWSIVPPTVARDGPAGRGAVQLWIDVDFEVDVLQLILTRDPRLRQMAVFDVVVNNADRKGGHILPTEDGDLHGCDHGICFASEPKLRTVLWGWKGEALTDDELRGVRRVREALDGTLGRQLRPLLAPAEVEALCRRSETLLRDGVMPLPDSGRHVIPWPPF